MELRLSLRPVEVTHVLDKESSLMSVMHSEPRWQVKLPPLLLNGLLSNRALRCLEQTPKTLVGRGGCSVMLLT